MKNETNEWPQTLNLSELAAEHDLHIIILPRPDPVHIEADSRIKQENTAHNRRKDWLLFRTSLCAFVVFGLLCGWIVLKTPTGSEGNGAMAILTVMMSGLVGYLTGRRQLTP